MGSHNLSIILSIEDVDEVVEDRLHRDNGRYIIRLWRRRRWIMELGLTEEESETQHNIRIHLVFGQI